MGLGLRVHWCACTVVFVLEYRALRLFCATFCCSELKLYVVLFFPILAVRWCTRYVLWCPPARLNGTAVLLIIILLISCISPCFCTVRRVHVKTPSVVEEAASQVLLTHTRLHSQPDLAQPPPPTPPTRVRTPRLVPGAVSIHVIRTSRP